MEENVALTEDLAELSDLTGINRLSSIEHSYPRRPE
jgi:hypothetical protein